ncbi:50S ribosomal protein L40e [Candidatus Micrarchaeota archaeon]|nr:50S ribosomal protein L40e [Candidatus Micrarchaeota archaeon]
MAKFPLAERQLLGVKVCLKCKSRNSKNALKCRKCSYTHLRNKRARRKEKA